MEIIITVKFGWFIQVKVSMLNVTSEAEPTRTLHVNIGLENDTLRSFWEAEPFEIVMEQVRISSLRSLKLICFMINTVKFIRGMRVWALWNVLKIL